MQVRSLVRSWRTAVARSGAVFLRDAGHGLLEVGHNSLALFGLLVVGIALFASSRSEVRRERIGITGYCMGGQYALMAACSVTFGFHLVLLSEL